MAQSYARAGGESLGIGDVSKICGMPVHTIRYWEREFYEFLHPSRTTGKQRRYTDDDIQKLLRLKKLLWTQRFSIKAAKRILAAGGVGHAGSSSAYLNTFDTRRLMMRLAQFAGSNMVVSQSAA